MFAGDLERFKVMRESFSEFPNTSGASQWYQALANEVVRWIMGGLSAIALCLPPRCRSGSALGSLEFALLLALFMSMRNLGLMETSAAAAQDVANEAFKSPLLTAATLSSVQIVVAAGTLMFIGWRLVARTAATMDTRLLRAFVGVNLALVSTTELVHFFQYGIKVGERLTAALAILVLLALVWETALSGRITNYGSEGTPRRARVFLYFGYALLVALAVFFFAPVVWRGVHVLGFDSEGWVSEGIVLLGVPWILTAFTIAIRRALRHDEMAAEEDRFVVRPTWRAIIPLVLAAAGVVALLPYGWIDPIRMFDVPNAVETNLEQISDNGTQLVGSYLDMELRRHGFVFSRGRFRTVDVPGSVATELFGVNYASHVVGRYVDSNGHRHGFLLTGRGFETIDVPSAVEITATGINYVPADAGVTGINYAGMMVGTFEDHAGHYHGFVRDGRHTAVLDLPGATDTEALQIADTGDIVGSYDGRNRTHGFVYSAGRWRRFDAPRGKDTTLNGINTWGHIVGSYLDDEGHRRSFVLTRDRMTLLDVPLTGLEVSGVDQDGDIVGRYNGGTWGLKRGVVLFRRIPH